MLSPDQIRARINERALCVEMDKNHCYWVTVNGKRVKYKGVTGSIAVLYAEGLENWKIDQQTNACELAGWDIYNNTLGLDLAGWKGAFREKLGAKRAGEVIADEAAEVGKGLHSLIESQQKRALGIASDSPDVPLRSHIGFRNWLPWAVASGLQPIAMEFRVFSEQYKYAGTVDWLGMYKGRLCCLDWKPKRPYPKNFLQLAAYTHALKEAGIDADAVIVCIDREKECEPRVVPVDNITDHFEAFTNALKLSRWAGKMRKVS